MSGLRLEHGDCAEVMASMKSNSVDAIVTDPPYGLAFMGADWDSFGASTGRESVDERRDKMNEYLGANAVVPAFASSHSHMPKLSEMREFQARMTPIFAEALRVAKPGAHLLCFGGTRTFHRMACAIEEAGWEVRDCIMWVYGSGFPKSMDVGKAIDKALGAERKKRNGDGEHAGNVDFGMKNRCPKCGKPYFSADPCKCPREDKVPVTDQAKQWDGWGTCLKPAWEPIIVARKPLDGTVAHNVLTWGVGALNIDACRVPTDETVENHSRSADAAKSKGKYGDSSAQETHQTNGQELGRFPANLAHDGSDDVLALFPDTGKSSGGGGVKAPGKNGIYGTYNGHEYPQQLGLGDSGNAARFFYCAKANKKDRGEGNDHPTVKPTALMEWLVRLVTPQGGVVLDPFMGSGSTGVAAKREGMGFIGIERDEHYFEIASRRLESEPATLF